MRVLFAAEARLSDALMQLQYCLPAGIRQRRSRDLTTTWETWLHSAGETPAEAGWQLRGTKALDF